MENRFLEMNDYLEGLSGKRNGRCNKRSARGSNGHAVGSNGYPGGYNGNTSFQSSLWSQSFAAADRALVILIENGGVDLGIPALVTKLLSYIPGADAIPEEYRRKLIVFIREKIKSFTDNLVETVELTANRYDAAKPSLFGDVIVLRDSTASYQELKGKLIDLSRNGKIVDVFILTHGGDETICLTGDISGQMISDMKKDYGKPLSIRSVYMMNCVGSSLNQSWLDAGAKVSTGSIRNNYIPEPTMFFFWSNWKDGQTFETAVTGAYRKTINLMNDAVRSFVSAIPIPGSSYIAGKIDFGAMDFVKDSAPVIQGQRSLTINSDNLSASQSVTSSLATTVLPVSLLREIGLSQSVSYEQSQSGTLSQQGVDFIKGWEGFRAAMYNDPVGHCTIGYGTLLHKGNCDGRESEQPYVNGINEEKATQLLAQKAAQFQKIVNDNVTVTLNQNQNDALVSFVYNVGGTNFQKSTLLRLLNQGDYGAVPTEMKKWTKARQNGTLVDLPGLVRRRAAEAELFQKPVTATAKSLSRFASASLSTQPALSGSHSYAYRHPGNVVMQQACYSVAQEDAGVPLNDVLPFAPGSTGLAGGWDSDKILSVGQIDPDSAVGKAIVAGPQALSTLNDSLSSQLSAELDTLKESDRYMNAVTEAGSTCAYFYNSLKTHLATYGELRRIARLSAALTTKGKDLRRSLLAWHAQPVPERGLVGTKPPEPIGLRENVLAQLDKWTGATEHVNQVAPGKPLFKDFRSPEYLLGQRHNAAKSGTNPYTTCVEFIGFALTNAVADSHTKLKVSTANINANLWHKDKRAKLPPGAWVDYTPGMKERPEPGDIYMLTFAEHVHKKGQPKTDANIKYYKDSFSHIGFVRSIKKNEVQPGQPLSETWEGVDGGAGTATTYSYEKVEKSDQYPKGEKYTLQQKGAEMIETSMRTFYPETNIFPSGVKNQDQGPRHLLGWVKIDKLV